MIDYDSSYCKVALVINISFLNMYIFNNLMNDLMQSKIANPDQQDP